MARADQFLARSLIFYLVDVGQQRLQAMVFANERRGRFAAQADSRDVVDRIASQGEDIADKPRRNVPFCGHFRLAEKRELIFRRGEIGFRGRINLYTWSDQLK